MHITVTVATAAAMLVVTKTRDATSAPPPDRATVEPPLKPNQQNHRIKQPRAPSVREWPGIARALPSLVYLPIRGPRMAAPIRAATPPTICTAVEPAKSWKPSSASQPPPPDPVTGNRVNDRRNNHRVNAVCREFGALCHRTGNDVAAVAQNTVWKIRVVQL